MSPARSSASIGRASVPRGFAAAVPRLCAALLLVAIACSPAPSPRPDAAPAIVASPAAARSDCARAFADAPPQVGPVIEALCSEHRSLDGVGVSLAIVVDGALLYSGGYGPRCDGEAEEVTSATRFRIGSITKLLTAATAAQLARARQLDLDAPLVHALPGYRPRPPADRATLRDALAHTSGLGDLRGDEPELADGRWLALINELAPERPPGVARRYTSTGYYLAGAVLEVSTGSTYAALVRGRVLAALGIEDVVVDEVDLDPATVACDHRRVDGRRVAYPVRALTPAPDGGAWMVPAGGALASVDALVTLAQRLPELASWEQLRATTGAPPFALIGRVRALPDGALVYGHAGNTGAQAVELAWVPARGFAVAIAGNTGRPYRATIDRAFRTFLGAPAYADAPRAAQPSSGSSASAAELMQ